MGRWVLVTEPLLRAARLAAEYITKKRGKNSTTSRAVIDTMMPTADQRRCDERHPEILRERVCGEPENEIYAAAVCLRKAPQTDRNASVRNSSRNVAMATLLLSLKLYVMFRT